MKGITLNEVTRLGRYVSVPVGYDVAIAVFLHNDLANLLTLTMDKEEIAYVRFKSFEGDELGA